MKVWRCVLVLGMCGLYAVEQLPDASKNSASDTKTVTVAALSKDVSRDPFALLEVQKTDLGPAITNTNELVLHGIAIADKSYALISLGNRLFTVTIKERVGEWRVHEIAFDHVVLKSSDETIKRLEIEQRINDEVA